MQKNLMFGHDSGESLPSTFSQSHKAWDAYMAEVWHSIFLTLQMTKNANVVEVGPGNSIKVALALKKLDFTGNIHLIDPIAEVLAESEVLYKKILPDANIYPIHATLEDVVNSSLQRTDYIVSNHPIDDMIIATTQPKDKLRALFDWTAIEHEQMIPISHENWSKLAVDTTKLQSLQRSICEEWYHAIDVLKPRYCVISQYASSTLKNNGMDGLNAQAKMILGEMRSHYVDSLIADVDIQTALNANTHYNDMHISNEVLNASNWLVIKPSNS